MLLQADEIQKLSQAYNRVASEMKELAAKSGDSQASNAPAAPAPLERQVVVDLIDDRVKQQAISTEKLVSHLIAEAIANIPTHLTQAEVQDAIQRAFSKLADTLLTEEQVRNIAKQVVDSNAPPSPTAAPLPSITTEQVQSMIDASISALPHTLDSVDVATLIAAQIEAEGELSQAQIESIVQITFNRLVEQHDAQHANERQHDSPAANGQQASHMSKTEIEALISNTIAGLQQTVVSDSLSAAVERRVSDRMASKFDELRSQVQSVLLEDGGVAKPDYALKSAGGSVFDYSERLSLRRIVTSANPLIDQPSAPADAILEVCARSLVRVQRCCVRMARTYLRDT
jgi:hypothetical protein